MLSAQGTYHHEISWNVVSHHFHQLVGLCDILREL